MDCRNAVSASTRLSNSFPLRSLLIKVAEVNPYNG